MNSRMFKYLQTIIIGILAFSQLHAFEKVGATSFQFLKVVPDARSTAMGEAYSSVADGSDGMYWNPAALMRSSGLSANLSHVDYIFDTSHFGVSVNYALNKFALGLMFMNVDYGDIEVTTVENLEYLNDGTYNPGLTGEIIQPGAMVAGIGFAQRLTNKFSYGVTANYVREDMVCAKQSLVMGNMGILYETGFRTITLAATMRNFGPQVEYFDYSYPIPQTLNIGISSHLIGGKEPLLIKSTKHQLLAAFDIVQPRDYDQQYNTGVEYLFMNMVALRAGYKMNYDTEGFTFGAGINLKGFSVDYSYNTYGEFLSGVNRFSFSFNR